MEKDVEASQPQKLSHIQQVFNVAGITADVENHNYHGAGTDDNPYVVNWIPNDPRNPMMYSTVRKWSITALVAFATLAVAFVSSAFSGGADAVLKEFGCSQEIFTLGLSLFVLGFAIGPLIWAPLSELFGRQILFVITYGALTAFNAGAAGSQNIQTLIVLRFFAGAFGSSPLTNAGGVIADMFPAKQRGLAMALFAAAPFLGPVLGPIVGGFVGETVGWRWIEGVMAIFTGVLWLMLCFLLPETYGPVILRRRAAALSKKTGKVYRSRGDVDSGPTKFAQVFKTSLLRPWILLFREPIVFLLSIYMAIIYGTLYMLFSAFPIVFQQTRGWSPGIGGLAFLGVGVGMIGAVAYSIWDNKRYSKVVDEHNGFAPPEARLPPTMLGGLLVPLGLIIFAWTNYAWIHWIVCILACVPFGFGMVLIFLGIMNYLIDAYTIFAASVLAANSVLRSLFGAAFPLFTSYMYQNLGIHWASSIPALLAFLCVPMPFLFYKFGPTIREKCKFAAESAAFMQRMKKEQEEDNDEDEDEEGGKNAGAESDDTVTGEDKEDEEKEPEFAPIRTMQSRRTLRRAESGYDSSPFDLDRVNTRESFKSGRSRSKSFKSTN